MLEQLLHCECSGRVRASKARRSSRVLEVPHCIRESTLRNRPAARKDYQGLVEEMRRSKQGARGAGYCFGSCGDEYWPLEEVYLWKSNRDLFPLRHAITIPRKREGHGKGGPNVLRYGLLGSRFRQFFQSVYAFRGSR